MQADRKVVIYPGCQVDFIPAVCLDALTEPYMEGSLETSAAISQQQDPVTLLVRQQNCFESAAEPGLWSMGFILDSLES